MKSPAKKSRRRWRRLIVVLAALAIAFGVLGCSSVVTPPKNPRDPTNIFILRDQLHIGIVMPDGQTPPQRYLEFGFGDWGYYALGRDAWYHTFATVLWSTQGALSRREFVAQGPEHLRRVAHWVELEELVVDAVLVNTLRTRLEAAFVAERARQIDRPELGMAFVPAAEGYWFANTCADVAAAWLEQLGCEVSWVPIRGSLVAAK